jgi:general secretion pathway protein A
MGPADSLETVNKGPEDAQTQALQSPAPSTAPGTDAPAPPSPASQPPGDTPKGASTDFSHFIQDMDARSARHIALQTVLELWGVNSSIDPALDERTDNDAFFETAARQNGLAMLRVDCRLDILNKLNLPAIISVRLPGGSSPGFLTVLGIRGDQVTLGRARLNETITVTKNDLEPYCADGVYIPWKDFMSPDGPAPNRLPRDAIGALKNQLKEIGYTQLDTGPSYDERTKEAVRQIQRKYGLEPDGIVGALTKIVLFNENQRLDIPHIRHD